MLKQHILDIKELSQKIMLYREAYSNIPNDIREEWERIRRVYNNEYLIWYNYQVERNPDL